MTSGEQITGIPDSTYDLVSVAYHALQGAEVCAVYASDAQEAGDQELAQLFQEVQQEERRCADRAMQLLGKRLQAS